MAKLPHPCLLSHSPCLLCVLALRTSTGSNMSDDTEDDEDDETQERVVEDEEDDASAEPDGTTTDASQEFVSLLVTLHFSTGQARILLERFLVEDPVVKAAVEVFRLENDTADLRDTLLRVVNHQERQPAEPAPATALAPSLVPADAALSTNERGAVMVQAMAEKGLLSGDEAATLLELLKGNDVMLAAAIDAFQVDENIEELYDTVKRIAKARMDPA